MQKLKSTNPKVSIIIPSYNHSKFIGKAIESVLYQTYENFELLIIDDASPDNSVDVIKKYEDPRIKFYGFETNQGAVDTLNHGIINSSSEYIALLNSDDYWEIDKLEKQVHFLEESDSVDCVFQTPILLMKQEEYYQKQIIFGQMHSLKIISLLGNG